MCHIQFRELSAVFKYYTELLNLVNGHNMVAMLRIDQKEDELQLSRSTLRTNILITGDYTDV